MGAGGTDSNPLYDVWAAEQQRLDDQVKYDPAFTAQLGRISDQIPAVAETIVRVLFGKPKKQN